MFCFFLIKRTAEFVGLDQRAVSNPGDARQGQEDFPMLTHLGRVDAVRMSP